MSISVLRGREEGREGEKEKTALSSPPIKFQNKLNWKPNFSCQVEENLKLEKVEKKKQLNKMATYDAPYTHSFSH